MEAKGLSCSINRIEEGHETKPHTHPYEQIAIILQGTCDYYVDGIPVRMKPGSWVVVPPDVEHYIHVFNSIEPVLNLDIFVPNRPEYTETFKKFLDSRK
ncbi:MAG: cupin domain-containing protein [Clostridia bacterium]|nr:cupin domain-containing protein [Clostridia bacterium]